MAVGADDGESERGDVDLGPRKRMRVGGSEDGGGGSGGASGGGDGGSGPKERGKDVSAVLKRPCLAPLALRGAIITVLCAIRKLLCAKVRRPSPLSRCCVGMYTVLIGDHGHAPVHMAPLGQLSSPSALLPVPHLHAACAQPCVTDTKFNDSFLPDRPPGEVLPPLDSPDVAGFTTLRPKDAAHPAPAFLTGTVATAHVVRHAPVFVSLASPADSRLVRTLKAVFACPVAFGEEVFVTASLVVADMLALNQEVLRPRVEACGVVHALLGAILHRGLPILKDLVGVGKALKAIKTMHV
jgi:hypothetical protein